MTYASRDWKTCIAPCIVEDKLAKMKDLVGKKMSDEGRSQIYEHRKDRISGTYNQAKKKVFWNKIKYAFSPGPENVFNCGVFRAKVLEHSLMRSHFKCHYTDKMSLSQNYCIFMDTQ